MSTGYSFQRLAEAVNLRTWGFEPDRQVKPGHFANGFFRALCENAGYPNLIQKAAGGFRKGKSRMPTTQFVDDIKDRLDAGEGGVDLSRVIELRAALELVVNQDNTLFGTNGPFSLTATHHLHTTSDPSDRGTGRFIAELLAARAGDQVTPKLRELLRDGSDNVYLLTAPLLNRERELGTSPTAAPDMEARISRTPLLRSIQDAYATLSMHSDLLEKTTFLQRVVNLGCFGLFLQVINQPPVTEGFPRRQVPILLCAQPSGVAMPSSRATFHRARQQVERSFETGLAAELSALGLDELTPSAYIQTAKEWLPRLDTTDTERYKDVAVWERFGEDFESHILGGLSVTEAFRRAALRACFLTMRQTGGEDPEGFATFVGRLSGLIYPRRQGRGDKYYQPTAEFLDTLVTALLEPTDEIPIEDFWDRAWERFGVVVGARPEQDARRLLDWGIRQVSSVDLAYNARQLLAELIRMGHAHEYADDIAMIRVGGSA